MSMTIDEIVGALSSHVSFETDSLSTIALALLPHPTVQALNLFDATVTDDPTLLLADALDTLVEKAERGRVDPLLAGAVGMALFHVLDLIEDNPEWLESPAEDDEGADADMDDTVAILRERVLSTTSPHKDRWHDPYLQSVAQQLVLKYQFTRASSALLDALLDFDAELGESTVEG